LDYSGPDGFPQQLAQHVGQVIVLDHHKTAAEQLLADSNHPANLAVCVDMGRSGATISRDFFKPELPSSLQEVFRWV
jgi:oligoribonuclease NrnB/cAMP/cGMP phosphodiesterase (DHH superfamily)